MLPSSSVQRAAGRCPARSGRRRRRGASNWAKSARVHAPRAGRLAGDSRGLAKHKKKKRRGGQLRVRPNVDLAVATHARARHCAVLPRAAPRRAQRVLVHDHGAAVRAEHNERNTGHVPPDLGLARRKVRSLSAAPSPSRMAGVLFYHQIAYTMCLRGEFTPFVACTLVVASDTADNSFCRFARYTFFSRGWIDFLRNARYNSGTSVSNVT